MIEEVKNHIKRFPVIESHYFREKSKRQFLSSNLNLHTIFELYLADSSITKKVGETTYRNIFNTCVNLGFHKPKKDRCEVCAEFENATPQQKEVLEQNYQIYQVNKAVTREIKANEKLLADKNPQIRACPAFDLQKVLNGRYGENGLFYYSRKLAVYSLTITDLATKDGYCYTWDQTTAKRGADEWEAVYFLM